MSSPRNEEIIPEEAAVFGSLQKQDVLLKLHENCSAAVLQAIRKTTPDDKTLSFERILELDASNTLLKEYSSLLLFDNMKGLIQNKRKIQLVFQDYIEQVIAGYRMYTEQGFLLFITRAKNAFGLAALFKLYKQMQASATFPTRLDLPDTEDKHVLAGIRALDIFLHLPQEVIKENFTARKIAEFFEQQMQYFGANPSKVNQQAKQPEPAARPAAPKPKPAASAQSKSQSRRFGGPANFYNAAVKEANEHVANMERYGVQMQAYKQQILEHNRIPKKCDLFSLIVNGIAIKLIQVSLDETASVHQLRDDFGNSALHLAALCGRDNVVRLLMGHGFDAETTNSRGNTAMHLAVLSANEDTMRTLVQEGCDINRDNNDEVNPLLLAMVYGEKLACILTTSNAFRP